MDIQKDVVSWRLGEEDSTSEASDQDSAVEICVAFKEDEVDKDDTTAEQHLLEGKDIQVCRYPLRHAAPHKTLKPSSGGPAQTASLLRTGAVKLGSLHEGFSMVQHRAQPAAGTPPTVSLLVAMQGIPWQRLQFTRQHYRVSSLQPACMCCAS